MPRIQLLHPGYAREEIGQVEFTGRRGTLVDYTDTNRYEIVDGGVTIPRAPAGICPSTGWANRIRAGQTIRRIRLISLGTPAWRFHPPWRDGNGHASRGSEILSRYTLLTPLRLKTRRQWKCSV